jgi:glycosyltransferase involved in cell wall biosynthesis
MMSIVIASRDRNDELARTLPALFEQCDAARGDEIIVVDDGSMVPVEMPTTPSLRLVRTDGLGRSAARNVGAAHASGVLLLFTDDDMTHRPDFVEAHRRAHESWPGALAVGAVRLEGQALTTPFGRFRQRLEDSGVPREAGLVEARNFCAAANMSIARTTFDALAGFDERMSEGEDQDFALRHTARGGRIVFVAEAVAIHRDDALDIRSYCNRVERGAQAVVHFCAAHPDLPQNRERAQVNGALAPGRERVSLSIRKVAKAVLGTAALQPLLFALIGFVERRAPEGVWLERLYRLALGVHIQRGYRRGLGS